MVRDLPSGACRGPWHDVPRRAVVALRLVCRRRECTNSWIMRRQGRCVCIRAAVWKLQTAIFRNIVIVAATSTSTRLTLVHLGGIESSQHAITAWLEVLRNSSKYLGP